MNQQIEHAAASADSISEKHFGVGAAIAAVIVMIVFTMGTAAAGTPAANTTSQTQNVNVVNTPTVNVGNTPSVSVANTPSVNVANTPAVSISGTPTVDANATITAPGPLTNVGRLASQHVTLQQVPGSTCATHLQQNKGDGSSTCFDLANYAGEALIITDTTFYAAPGAGATCGMALNGFGGGFTLFFSDATGAADGVATKSEHLTTGVAITANPVVIPTCGVGELILLQGYLVPNQ